MPDGDPDSHEHGGGECCPSGLQLGLSPAAEAGLLRQLGVEGVDNIDGNRHRQAVHTVNSAMSGTGAPRAVFRPIAANVTESGTASASAYQIQLTPPAD
jgi:hypothetical protein